VASVVTARVAMAVTSVVTARVAMAVTSVVTARMTVAVMAVAVMAMRTSVVTVMAVGTSVMTLSMVMTPVRGSRGRLAPTMSLNKRSNRSSLLFGLRSKLNHNGALVHRLNGHSTIDLIKVDRDLVLVRDGNEVLSLLGITHVLLVCTHYIRIRVGHNVVGRELGHLNELDGRLGLLRRIREGQGDRRKHDRCHDKSPSSCHGCLEL